MMTDLPGRPRPWSSLVRRLVAVPVLGLAVFFPVGCASNLPTLVQVARERQHPEDKDKRYGKYEITDCDILNYTDQVKILLASKGSHASALRYGSSTTQVTLASLAGAAQTAGWGVAAASGLAQGSAFISLLGSLIDAKGHAQAFDQALNAVQSAESTFYFRQLGLRFQKKGGRTVVDDSAGGSRGGIPSADVLTRDGETLYYRVTKILNVLNDVLSNKIPDLQDLKGAAGETTGADPVAPSPGPTTPPTPPPVRPPPTPGPDPVVDPTPTPTLKPRVLTMGERIRFAIENLNQQSQTDPAKVQIARQIFVDVGTSIEPGETALVAFTRYGLDQKKDSSGKTLKHSETALASALDKELPSWSQEMDGWLAHNTKMRVLTYGYVANGDDTTPAAILRDLNRAVPPANKGAAKILRNYTNTLELTLESIDKADQAFKKTVPAWKPLR